MPTLLAAKIFGALTGIVAVFQLALAAGMPWGKLAMGGRFPGKYPPFMRLICLLQVLVLALLATIVLARAGVLLPGWYPISRTLIWGVVAFGVVALVANLVTPSRWERILWAPVAAAMLLSSLVVAIG